MDDPITWQSLGTVAVAAGVSGSLVAFLRIFMTLSEATARKLAAVFGVVIVELAVITLGASGWKEILLGFFTGVAAGLAASQTVDVAQAGWNHRIT